MNAEKKTAITTTLVLTLPEEEVESFRMLATEKGWVCVKLASYSTDEKGRVRTTDQIH